MLVCGIKIRQNEKQEKKIMKMTGSGIKINLYWVLFLAVESDRWEGYSFVSLICIRASCWTLKYVTQELVLFV